MRTDAQRAGGVRLPRAARAQLHLLAHAEANERLRFPRFRSASSHSVLAASVSNHVMHVHACTVAIVSAA